MRGPAQGIGDMAQRRQVRAGGGEEIPCEESQGDETENPDDKCLRCVRRDGRCTIGEVEYVEDCQGRSQEPQDGIGQVCLSRRGV